MSIPLRAVVIVLAIPESKGEAEAGEVASNHHGDDGGVKEHDIETIQIQVVHTSYHSGL